MESNELKPQGGCPSRLASDEIECLYCSRTIGRVTKHRTCSECAKRWTETFGPEWHKESWHAELVPDHIRTFGGNSRAYAQSLDTLQERADIVPLSEVGQRNGWKPRAEYITTYYAIKDILIVGKMRGEIAIGMKKMQARLIARGYRVRGPEDEGKRGVLWLPDLKTIEKYIAKAHDEIAAEGYFGPELQDIWPESIVSAAQFGKLVPLTCPMSEIGEQPSVTSAVLLG